MNALIQELRFGLRMLWKQPGFTAMAVLTLGLGIGANAALFSVVNWMLFRPLPMDRPAQMAFLTIQQKGRYTNGFSYPDLDDIRKQSGSAFSHVAGWEIGQDGLTAGNKTQPIMTGYVTGDFFAACGIKPAAGRFILPSEGATPGADPVIVLSYDYWMSRFGGDASVVGSKMAVNGQPVTVIGIAPQGFHGPTQFVDTQGYLPFGMKTLEAGLPAAFMSDRSMRSMVLIARRKDGVSLEQARAVAAGIGERLANAYPDVNEGMKLHVWPLTPTGMSGNPGQNPVATVGALFLGLAILVLVLACLNVANMLLVRAAGRRREMAVRAALGAPRARLIRQVLAESVSLALLAGVAGGVFGLAVSRAMSSVNLQTSFPFSLDFQFDWRVFAYTFGIAAFTGVLAGIVPALRGSRMNLAETLYASGRSATAGRQRLRSALVVGQVAGSLALLVVAGLFTRSLAGAHLADWGFDPQHVLNMTIDPHAIGYNEVQGRAFYTELLSRVRALPGVQYASVAATIPTGEIEDGGAIVIAGRPIDPGTQGPSANWNFVSTGYFQTMSIPLLRGRAFAETDRQESQFVAVINEEMSRKFWPNEDPIGKRFSLKEDAKHEVEIVGVVKNSKTGGLVDDDAPFFYAPVTQHYSSLTFLQIRAFGAPEAVTGQVIKTIDALAPTMPVYGVRTMAQSLKGVNGLLLFQIGAFIAGSLGILGLVLATIGVYGVISYAAAQRTREMGIRAALGARPADILKMVGREGGGIIGAGILVGIALALALGHVMKGLLLGVGPADPVTFVTVSLGLAAIGAAASYIPARRASRVDPMVALRHE
ncbi:MAG TPA: ABC transporter permease [Candidatus Acidoferrales bacterium]|nr:ABC transporter permease [Candidatus Acidoferrales bacterium]